MTEVAIATLCAILFTHQLQSKQNLAQIKRKLSEAWGNYNGRKTHTQTYMHNKTISKFIYYTYTNKIY